MSLAHNASSECDISFPSMLPCRSCYVAFMVLSPKGYVSFSHASEVIALCHSLELSVPEHLVTYCILLHILQKLRYHGGYDNNDYNYGEAVWKKS